VSAVSEIEASYDRSKDLNSMAGVAFVDYTMPTRCGIVGLRRLGASRQMVRSFVHYSLSSPIDR